ncbi:MAG: hypothetical protein KJZ80_18755 [Hyphomicrobiaceae bacterium]|nr:hypothetical protein [Hyphomicrobiaceae bacterium]
MSPALAVEPRRRPAIRHDVPVSVARHRHTAEPAPRTVLEARAAAGPGLGAHPRPVEPRPATHARTAVTEAAAHSWTASATSAEATARATAANSRASASAEATATHSWTAASASAESTATDPWTTASATPKATTTPASPALALDQLDDATVVDLRHRRRVRDSRCNSQSQHACHWGQHDCFHRFCSFSMSRQRGFIGPPLMESNAGMFTFVSRQNASADAMASGKVAQPQDCRWANSPNKISDARTNI